MGLRPVVQAEHRLHHRSELTRETHDPRAAAVLTMRRRIARELGAERSCHVGNRPFERDAPAGHTRLDHLEPVVAGERCHGGEILRIGAVDIDERAQVDMAPLGQRLPAELLD